jgi:glycosyltransferase involved in cell wall biosynthesis
MSAAVTAIVPTLADMARRASLLRALGSLERAALRARVTITVVVNGQRDSPAVIEDLHARNVRLIRIEQASLPAALREGRRTVDTPFFCFLDDDDEYLESAIDRRLAAMARAPACALVASNGYRCVGDVSSLALSGLAQVPRDPLAALLNENWLPSCGGLFRSDAIGTDFFDDIHQYFEWTWLAFRIARAGCDVAVLDEPTFRIHDTAISLSKSPAYLAASVTLCRRMLQEGLSPAQEEIVRDRLCTVLSRRSVALLRQGDLSAAWTCHLQTLRNPGGWRYAHQTLRLVSASLRSLVAAGTPPR